MLLGTQVTTTFPLALSPTLAAPERGSVADALPPLASVALAVPPAAALAVAALLLASVTVATPEAGTSAGTAYDSSQCGWLMVQRTVRSSDSSNGTGAFQPAAASLQPSRA